MVRLSREQNQPGGEPIVPHYTLEVLIILVEALPIGTNKALLHFMWTLVSGALLAQRGALFPALQSTGLEPDAVRRAWRAFRKGKWHIEILIQWWRAYVKALPNWEAHEYEGYQPVPIDITAFWRPELKNCPSQHYHPKAGRALPAVIMGIVGDVGTINGQRLTLPRHFMRVRRRAPDEATLQMDLLRQAGRQLGDKEIAVFDAGFKLSQIHATDLQNYLVRLPRNFTAHRNEPAPYKGKGRYPIYGEKVRPLSRTYAGREIAATAPDEEVTWKDGERTIRAKIWRDLVRPGVVPGPEACTFDVYVIEEPRFAEPWVLGTPVKLTAQTVQAMYIDRWPIEQIPLSAKHMVGAHRQFVFAAESIHRLPELALLMGSVLSFLAATAPATPTGFWDRNPHSTPGRFRRTLQGRPFPESYRLPQRIREKASVTDHLPKGVKAHRRQTQRMEAAIRA